jgi:hypothetical protein
MFALPAILNQGSSRLVNATVLYCPQNRSALSTIVVPKYCPLNISTFNRYNFYQSTEPVPSGSIQIYVGNKWFNTSNSVIKTWNGSAWV